MLEFGANSPAMIGFALDGAVAHAKLHGNPISRDQAEVWLKEVFTPDCKEAEEWMNWRLDNIFN